MSYNYLFKFIIVGETGVGKTCLVYQLTSARFKPVYEVTIGAEFGSRTITVDRKPIKLQIWDTAGQEKLRSLTRLYVIINWLEDLQKHGDEKLTVMVVGNKCDLDEETRAVSKEEGEEFAEKNECLFMEVSARTAKNVEVAFGIAAEEICGKIGKGDFGTLEGYKGITIGNSRGKSKRFYSCLYTKKTARTNYPN
ncbi:ras-related protein RABB1b-like [Solanum stenotomum]|uniref:ras-related protein RABB1b-like n=1 Tax=Solanum stenotomum TaxID=172797 RepID=UPI0020D0A3A2|nr:ras-related protein RABB1b-like [Solanum stenotomum]